MGKNKDQKIMDMDQARKTQQLEQTRKRLPKGFFKRDPADPK